MYNIFFRVGRSKWRPPVLICLSPLCQCPGEGYSCSFLEIPWVPHVQDFHLLPELAVTAGHTPLLPQFMSSRGFHLPRNGFALLHPNSWPLPLLYFCAPVLQTQTELLGFCFCCPSFLLPRLTLSPAQPWCIPPLTSPSPSTTPERGSAGGQPGASLEQSLCPSSVLEWALDPFAQHLVEMRTDNAGWRLLVLAVMVSLMCVVFPRSPFQCRWRVGAAPVKWPMQLL